MQEQGNQFTKFDVLPCNYRFEWIEVNGQNRYKRRMWGCDRQQLSYTAGTWVDRYFHALDNVEKSYLPLNPITENINYVGEDGENQRMIVSAKVKNPIAWKVTKIENTHPIGLLQVTFSQVAFNTHSDYIERDENGRIIGMWADYYTSDITPTDPTESTPTPLSNYSTITASTSTIKIGGSYKTLTVTVFDESGNDITDTYSDAVFNWTCSIKGVDSTEVDTVITCLDGTTFNKKKIKFSNDRSYLEKILEVKCEIIKDTETIETVMQFELIV